MENTIRNFGIGLILALFTISASAKNYVVSNAQEIADLKLQPGDKVILKAGDWKNQSIAFKGKGTVEQPIILTTEKLGLVISSGNSTLKIDGEYLVVDGLAFADGYSEKDAVVTFSKNSSNCRLTNTSIVNYNHPLKTVDYKWVSVFGIRNRVDHCNITGKTHQGTTLVVWLSETPNYTQIDHNYFGPRPDLGVNGGETIRIGTSDWSMYDSFAKVEYNIFDKCNGETEIISIKSANNLVTNNLFYECVGTVTFRHGNNSEVSNNFFIGNGVKNTGGIRIIGENQKVNHNYLQGIMGTDLRSAISVMNALENPKLNEYWQVKNALISNNTIVNCKEALTFGAGADSKRIIPSTGLKVEDNLVINSTVFLNVKAKPLNAMVQNNEVLGIFTPTDGFTKAKIETKINKYQLYQKANAVQPFWLFQQIGPSYFKMPKFNIK